MLLNNFLEQSAARLPQKVALVCPDQSYTYLEIETQANCLANMFIQTGVKKQDRIAIYLGNSAEAVISIFAALKAGAVFTLVNPAIKPNKLAYLLTNSGAKALVTDSRKFAGIREVCVGLDDLDTIILTGQAGGSPILNKKILFWEDILATCFSEPLEPLCINIDLASIIYTSSTTGKAKGVMLTHLNMVSAATSITQYLQNIEEDVILNVLPLSFDYGLYQVLMAFKMGATLILEKSFIYTYPVIEKLVKHRVTGFPLVPTIVSILMQLKDLAKYDFSSLRYLTNTAQAISPRQTNELQRIFPTARFYSMYGLTECKRVSYLPPEQLVKRPTSVGKAMPNIETYLVDENGTRITEPGKIGELVVRGSNVMQGYWKLPEETAKKLKTGLYPWERQLNTGDLFKLDEEGYLYFISRKDDIIKSAGEQVSPKELEDVLYEMKDIVEAAVIGKPDEILGQAIKAVVVLQETSDLTAEDIIRHCSRNVESYMIPKYVEIVKELPKTTTGKMSKKDL